MTPLLLLHGYPFDHSMWGRVMEHLPPQAPVLAPDLRGFDGTSPPDQPPSMELMARDLDELMGREGLQRAVVAGFSMGGYVALALAENHPDRIAGLALINSQAAPDTDATKQARRTMIDRVRLEGPGVAVEAALPKMFATPVPVDSDLASFPRHGAARAGAAGICWALEAMAQRPDRTSVLRTLEAPVLVLHSQHDQFIPVENARSLARSIPGAVYEELPGAGHCSPLEDPAAVADSLTRFMERCP